jgi:hypothetical protein
VTHFVDVSVCSLENRDCLVSSEVVVCETLLVGAEFVAWGASSKLKGFRDRGHRGLPVGLA